MPAEPITSFMLRCRLEELVTGVIDLAEFDEWLTGEAWEAARLDPDAADLSGHIGLLIDEYSGGAWTWGELKDRLQQAASTVVVSWGGPPQLRISTGATSQVIPEVALAGRG
jgi:hypothetical protein